MHSGDSACSLPPYSLPAEIIAEIARQTEALARGVIRPASPAPAARPDKDADTRALEADLTANLRLKVSIDHKPGANSGELRIRYANLDELDGLCQLLGR